jgi:hypothetical protein
MNTHSHRGFLSSGDAKAVVFVLLLSFALGAFGAFGQVAKAAPARPLYACTYHCYGYNDWPGGPINGSVTYIKIVQLSCSFTSCSNGPFIDNEMWLNDLTNPNGACPCFVEAGYTTIAGSHQTRYDYFWGDNRPTWGIFFHDLAQIPAGDYGNYTQFYINRSGSSSFQVYVASANYNATQYSTSNSMTPGDINIGSELYGTAGASAPTAHFIYNIWIDTSGVSHYQSVNGTLKYLNGPPPYRGWTTPPIYSSSGGDLYTYCC